MLEILEIPPFFTINQMQRKMKMPSCDKYLIHKLFEAFHGTLCIVITDLGPRVRVIHTKRIRCRIRHFMAPSAGQGPCSFDKDPSCKIKCQNFDDSMCDGTKSMKS